MGHPPQNHHPSSTDNNVANFYYTAVKFERDINQSLPITIVGSISIRVRRMFAIVANFLLGSVRSIFLLFLTLVSLIWILKAYNWAFWLAKSTFLLSIDFPSFWKSSRVVRFFQTFGASRRNNRPIFAFLFGMIITTFRGCVVGIYRFGWV